MSIVVPTETSEIIGLAEFVDYLRSHLDVNNEASIVSASGKLLALARNRRFLVDYLAGALDRPDFQADNTYADAAFILAADQKRGFMVRAVAWRPLSDLRPFSPSGYSDRGLATDSVRLAHTHDFGLLTVGYWGEGYETDVFGVPDDLHQREVGDRIDLRSIGRFQLAQDVVLYYPAYRVAHIQHAPLSYSISLNLITRGHRPFVEQCHVDLDDSTLVSKENAGNLRRSRLLDYAATFPNASFISPLEQIAANHPATVVRAQALRALDRCRGHEQLDRASVRG